MNSDERLGCAKQSAEPLSQVVQCVAVLGKNDQLAPMPCASNISAWFCRSAESSSHFLSVPLRRTLSANASSFLRDLDFGLKFSDGARRRRLIDDGLFRLFDLCVGRVIQIVDVFFCEAGQLPERRILKKRCHV